MSRRALLRGLVSGAAVSVGLPLFECMLNSHGTAMAAGDTLPRRFGFFFWGCGVWPDKWVPSTTGANWTPSAALQPLLPVRDYVSVLTNMQFQGNGNTHYLGRAMMTSGHYNPSGGDRYGAPGGASMDQLVAKAFAGKCYKDSVVYGVSRKGQGEDTAEPMNPRDASWVADSQPNYVEYSVANFYNTLFGGVGNLQTLLQRKSILDAVQGNMQSLRKRLGTADQQRLDQHADGIRQMETSISVAQKACTTPQAPMEIEGASNHEPLQERSRAFADMLTIALACDLTRVFNVQFTGRECDTVFWQVGATDGVHHLTHNPDQASHDTCQASLVFTMTELAYLLGKLQSTPEGAGNLLDSCAIIGTSEIGNPNVHSYGVDVPLLIAGRAGGALKSGLHYSSPNAADTMSMAQLTVLRAMGLNLASFGEADALATQSLAALAP